MTDAIPIRNLYYMLAYAYRCLDQRDFSGLEAEPFENACDLFAAILARGLSGQIRRGLERSYVPRREPLSSPGDASTFPPPLRNSPWPGSACHAGMTNTPRTSQSIR